MVNLAQVYHTKISGQRNDTHAEKFSKITQLIDHGPFFAPTFIKIATTLAHLFFLNQFFVGIAVNIVDENVIVVRD